MGKEETTK